MKPTVGDNGDVVIRRNWFEHRHVKRHDVIVFGVTLVEDEGVVEEDNFAINIFHHDMECFGRPVYFFLPSEVRGDDEFDV